MDQNLVLGLSHCWVLLFKYLESHMLVLKRWYYNLIKIQANIIIMVLCSQLLEHIKICWWFLEYKIQSYTSFGGISWTTNKKSRITLFKLVVINGFSKTLTVYSSYREIWESVQLFCYQIYKSNIYLFQFHLDND